MYNFLTDTIERGANTIGMSILPSATPDSSPILHFLWGGGDNAAWGLISKDITYLSRERMMREDC